MLLKSLFSYPYVRHRFVLLGAKPRQATSTIAGIIGVSADRAC
jgi:hypothetical protein